MRSHNVVDALDEGGRVELRAHNLVRAVGENGDAPVADESDELPGLRRLDLGAHVLGVRNAALPFNVDQDKVVGAAPEQGQSFAVAERGINFETRDSQDLITKRAQHLATADV